MYNLSCSTKTNGKNQEICKLKPIYFPFRIFPRKIKRKKKTGERSWRNILWRITEAFGFLYFGEKDAQGWPHPSLQMLFSPPCLFTRHIGMSQSCARECSGFTWGSIYLLGNWWNVGTAFLERWSMSQTCQCLRSIWTMTIRTFFNSWRGLK